LMQSYILRLMSMINHYNRTCIQPGVRSVFGVRCSPGLIKIQKALMNNAKAKVVVTKKVTHK